MKLLTDRIALAQYFLKSPLVLALAQLFAFYQNSLSTLPLSQPSAAGLSCLVTCTGITGQCSLNRAEWPKTSWPLKGQATLLQALFFPLSGKQRSDRMMHT